ncbi:MAG: hypothetical protein AAF533_30095 [Acidobacteriota bacterium]
MAQTVWSGLAVDGTGGGCAPPVDSGTGELYVLKLDQTGNNITDWHYDLRNRSAGNVGGAEVGSVATSILGGNFTFNESPTDRIYVFVTYERSSSEAGDRVYLDSGSPAEPNMGANVIQIVGETISSAYANHAGTGLLFPGDGTPLSVDLGAGARSFPAAGPSAVDVLFGALIDFQPIRFDPMSGCGFGGDVELHGNPMHGAVIGYNVYRQEDLGGAAPDPMSWDESDWLGFIPHHEFVLGAMPGSNDDEPNPEGDYAGHVDLDAIPYNGNEHVFFSDTNVDGRPTPGPLARAEPGTDYWYVMQPVVHGMHDAFDETTAIARLTLGFDPKNGPVIDLDNDGVAEFYSPQATHGGFPGLGLTNGGRPVLSAAVRGARADDPLGIGGRLLLSPGRSGGLELASGLETADVTGYDVYRLQRDGRIKVNRDRIVANGGEGFVYQVADRLLARRGGASYEVEVHRTDGSASVEGPFRIESGRRSAARRLR